MKWGDRKISSGPTSLTEFAGQMYFTADDGTHGTELWKTDGTADGTTLVKDITPGTGDTTFNEMIAVGDTLFFANRNLDDELWKSDGTESGTVQVKDIEPGMVGSFPHDLRNVEGQLLFNAFTTAYGNEIWVSDGTEGGTMITRDINPGPADSNPFHITVHNGAIYFEANDGATGPSSPSPGGCAARAPASASRPCDATTTATVVATARRPRQPRKHRPARRR